MKPVVAMAIALVVSSVRASAAGPPSGPELRFDEFLAAVVRANLTLAAQRMNVTIAEAQVSVARLFPEPTLSAGIASFDIRATGAPTATTLAVSETVELGGKRHNRIRVAEAGVASAKSDLDDFFRTLRAQASNAFIDALSARLVLERKQRTLDSLNRLVGVNEQRLRAGDIGQVAVMQSRVEAERFRGEVLLAEGDIRNSDLALGLQAGAAQPVTPVGNLQLEPRTFDADQLIARAREQRADVRSARLAVEAGKDKIALAESNRTIDLTFGLGWLHSFKAGGDYATIAPTPSTDMVSATVTIPLPFARTSYRGELDAAIAGRSQAERLLSAAELKAEVEIRQALARYVATVDRLKLYTGGILTDADKVLEATIYNYQHGGATLLEVLEAQRTVDDVYLAYAQALTDHAHALVAVEQASGFWDLRF